jgi:hypothetical protein
MKNLWKSCLVLILGGVLGLGCILTPRQELIASSATRIATYRVVGSNVQRADAVADYAQRMVEDIEAGRLVTLSMIERETNRIVRRLTSNPVEAASWSELIGLISAELHIASNEKLTEVEKIHKVILPRLRNVAEAARTMQEFLENE